MTGLNGRMPESDRGCGNGREPDSRVPNETSRPAADTPYGQHDVEYCWTVLCNAATDLQEALERELGVRDKLLRVTKHAASLFQGAERDEVDSRLDALHEALVDLKEYIG